MTMTGSSLWRAWRCLGSPRHVAAPMVDASDIQLIKYCLSKKVISFDEWFDDESTSVDDLEALETVVINNPVTGNIQGFLRPYLNLHPLVRQNKERISVKV
jgi:hypothetical protein